MPPRAAALLLFALLLVPSRDAWPEQRIVLPIAPNLTEPFLYDAAAKPVASLILFIGGDGDIAHNRDTFLLRVRRRFVRAGMSIAVPDTPSDHPGGFGPYYRLGGVHMAAVAAIAAFLRHKAPAPVWAVGHSNGTISAAAAAERLGPHVISGVVLVSAVWLGGLGEVPVGYITVPVMLVQNRLDACPVSEFSLAQLSPLRFAGAPAEKFVALDGKPHDGDPCGPHSPHDLYGIENEAVPAIVAWVRTHNTPPARP